MINLRTHRSRNGRFGSLGAVAGLCAGLVACGTNDPSNANTVAIGLLLPFTGTTSATANNFERAMLYASDRINAKGGVNGRQIRIVSADTHSDLDRASQSTDDLIAAGVVAIVGPESSEIAAAISPKLAAHNVALLSPNIGAANDATVDCTHPWFRLAPSAGALGEALAKLAFTENLTSIVVLYAAGAYNEALSQSVSTRFTSLGGRTALVLQLDPNAASYADAVRQTVAANVQSVVLATSPRTAAHVVNEFEISSGLLPRWVLSPVLKTDLLVKNVVPGALEGALGVAPKIYDSGVAFPKAFGTSWQGDEPLEGAYFYYDAMSLLGLALEKTTVSATGTVDVATFEANILHVAGPPGVAVSWDEIESGVQQLGAGSSVYYSGLTGPMLLASCGSRQIGATTTWVVTDGIITDRAN
jgi:ABC-type branched-subunit amino acid transport system substrate-binding protein